MAETRDASQGTAERVTLSEIQTIARDIDDIDAAAIIATGATRAEFEEAYHYARGDGDVMARSGRPLVGAAAEVYEILVEQDEDEETAVKQASP